jgi:copper ion binding protein
MKRIIKIEGMSCQHCVNHVKSALEEIEGISNVFVNLDTNSASVDFEGHIEYKVLEDAISEVGYKVISIN